VKEIARKRRERERKERVKQNFQFSFNARTRETNQGVNFINILHAAFTLVGPKSAKWHCWLDCLFLCIRDLLALKLYTERWWNWALESISSTFYWSVFRTNVQNAFLDTFQLCYFWCQNIGEESAHKMLMKLTPGELNELSPLNT